MIGLPGLIGAPYPPYNALAPGFFLVSYHHPCHPLQPRALLCSLRYDNFDLPRRWRNNYGHPLYSWIACYQLSACLGRGKLELSLAAYQARTHRMAHERESSSWQFVLVSFVLDAILVGLFVCERASWAACWLRKGRRAIARGLRRHSRITIEDYVP